MAGEVAHPKVVLKIQALTRQGGKAEQGVECLTRVPNQTYAGERAVGRCEVVKEGTKLCLLRMLPGLTGHLLEPGGEGGTGGQQLDQRVRRECREAVAWSHRAESTRVDPRPLHGYHLRSVVFRDAVGATDFHMYIHQF